MINQILTFILGGIGILAFLGTVTVYLRGSADKGTITSLKESVAALQISDGIKTAEIADLKRRLTASETENELLRGTVTQKQEVAALTKMLGDHHTESIAKLDEIREAMPHDR